MANTSTPVPPSSLAPPFLSTGSAGKPAKSSKMEVATKKSTGNIEEVVTIVQDMCQQEGISEEDYLSALTAESPNNRFQVQFLFI